MKRVRILTVVMVLCFCINLMPFYANAIEITEDEILDLFNETVLSENEVSTEQDFVEDELIPCTATLEDEFSDNMIIVYLKRGFGEDRQYTEDDFPYLDLSSVETVFEYNAETNNRVGLYLYLNTPSKQNVLNAIQLLEQDEKIHLVSPNFKLFFNNEEVSVYDNDTNLLVQERDTIEQLKICCASKYTNSFAGLNSQSSYAPVKIGIIDSGVWNGSSVANKVYEYIDICEGVSSSKYVDPIVKEKMLVKRR